MTEPRSVQKANSYQFHHGSRHHNGRVNGVAHTAFDPVKGDVDVTGRSGALTIEAVY